MNPIPTPETRDHTGDPTTESNGPRRSSGWGRIAARVALAIWMPAVALGVGSLMVGHWAPLPQPEAEAGGPLAQSLRELTSVTPASERPATQVEEREHWSVVHVLYEGCGCSRRVVDYLLSPERSASSVERDLDEWILLVGDEGDGEDSIEGAATAAGYRVRRETQASLAERYGIESAPLFVALDTSGNPAFVGGYTLRKQGLVYEDLNVLDQLQAGGAPDPIPVFGCGVSTSLQTALDPLRIKYR